MFLSQLKNTFQTDSNLKLKKLQITQAPIIVKAILTIYGLKCRMPLTVITPSEVGYDRVFTDFLSSYPILHGPRAGKVG